MVAVPGQSQEKLDAGRKPVDEPVQRREQMRFLEAVGSAFLAACQQHVAARQPDVGRIAALFNGGIREHQRSLQIAASSERHRFRSQQLGFLGKFFQRIVGPEFGLAELAHFDERPDLARPGGGVLRVELEYFGVKP